MCALKRWPGTPKAAHPGWLPQDGKELMRRLQLPRGMHRSGHCTQNRISLDRHLSLRLAFHLSSDFGYLEAPEIIHSIIPRSPGHCGMFWASSTQLSLSLTYTYSRDVSEPASS